MHIRPIGRRYGADLRFSLAGRAARSASARSACLSGKFGDEGGDCDGSVVNTSCAEEQRKRRDVSTSARGRNLLKNMKDMHGK